MPETGRRAFLTTLATTVAAGASVAATQRAATPDATAAKAAKAAMPQAPRLAPLAFRPLPLGAIRPSGWLERQLKIQAAGLTGHLDEFWPDVADSQWFGGKAEGWERAPYWLDGAIPLAWTINDAAMKARITRYVDHIVSSQRADGWYAPYPEDAVAKRYDMWAILLANKVLVQYHDATGDARVLTAVSKSLRAMAQGLDRTPLYNWGKYRWFEGLVSVFYVYERTREPWLLDLAAKLRAQGMDYAALFKTDDLMVPTPRRGLWKWTKHVVNTGMAVKASALAWRLDQRAADRAWTKDMIAFLDRYHGQATGMFSGDECLAGRSPLQGTELCAVVEFMYSLEHAFSVFGDPVYGDRLERVAFNALPATLSPDMWSHQYVQQVNQAQCTINADHQWSTNGPESNLFGLEPNFGCCTSNLHQGWPKFVSHLWMRTPDDGIAAMAYAPSRASFEAKGATVEVALNTDYPFRDRLSLTVRSSKAARFPVLLRVPAWTTGATLTVGGVTERLASGTMHRVERTWSGETVLTLVFPMTAKVTERYNGAVAIERGPLVYSLKLGEEWKRVNAEKPHRELPHGDFEVRPTSAWNYGVVMNGAAAKGLTFTERPMGDQPFSPEGTGMSATVSAKKITTWRLQHGWAGEVSVPDGDTADKGRVVTNQPEETVTLIPYGCTNIRITEFPKV